MSRQQLSIYLALTVASLKMYFRNRQAIFWALFFPLLIMMIFGLLDFDSYNAPEVGYVDRAQNEASGALRSALAGSDGDQVLDLEDGELPALQDKLSDGNLDAVIEVPEGFGEAGDVSTITVTYDSANPEPQGVVASVLSQTLETLFREIADVPDEYQVESRFAVEYTTIDGEGQGFAAFLVPGVAAMAIMQSGIFSVVFTLVRFRSQGVLRRLNATPIGPAHFLVGQLTTRMLVVVLQTYVLIAVGMIVLGVTIADGSLSAWIDITLMAIFGGALFISLGLAISGWAKSEDTAAPLANIVTLPMIFLSGVFFPSSVLPDWVSGFAEYMPLTYLADGMRAITVDGASVFQLGSELIGLGAWTAGAFILATRLFKWE